jgi:hypothetical protein
MKSKLTLPNGTTGFTDDNGKRVCTGARMGRMNILPNNRSLPVKLHLEKLQLIDGAYDRWGAYWGSPNNLYCAWAMDGDTAFFVLIFMRADNRTEARKTIQADYLSEVKYYR